MLRSFTPKIIPNIVTTAEIPLVFSSGRLRRLFFVSACRNRGLNAAAAAACAHPPGGSAPRRLWQHGAARPTLKRCLRRVIFCGYAAAAQQAAAQPLRSRGFAAVASPPQQAAAQRLRRLGSDATAAPTHPTPPTWRRLWRHVAAAPPQPVAFGAFFLKAAVRLRRKNQAVAFGAALFLPPKPPPTRRRRFLAATPHRRAVAPLK